jgi:hypothetical protein
VKKPVAAALDSTEFDELSRIELIEVLSPEHPAWARPWPGYS